MPDIIPTLFCTNYRTDLKFFKEKNFQSIFYNIINSDNEGYPNGSTCVNDCTLVHTLLQSMVVIICSSYFDKSFPPNKYTSPSLPEAIA